MKRLRRDTTSGQSVARPAAEPAPRGRRPWPWLAALVLVAAGGALAWWRSKPGSAPPAGPLKITPFTTGGGTKAAPELSPDGERVAFAWDGPSGDNADVYVQALGVGATPIRLTTSPAWDGIPVWSPDGRQVAFLRIREDDAAALYTVPSLGGQERKPVDIAGPLRTPGLYFIPTFSWSPKGDWLALAEKATAGGPPRIVRLSLETLEKQTLTAPPPGSELLPGPLPRRPS